jgi:hypothetical protein
MPENRPVPRRRPPRPAPDEGVDPVVPALAAVPQAAPVIPPTPAAAPQREHRLPADVPRRRRGTPTVQVNLRLPAEVATLLDDVAESTGALKSEIIESAIRHAYGPTEG